MQLRDAQTSELIAEGTPLEIATLAAELNAADILFDDCGAAFDPAQVRAFRSDELAGMEAQLAAMPAAAPNGQDQERHREVRQTLRDTIQERRDRIQAGKQKATGARQAMSDARDRVAKRQRRG